MAETRVRSALQTDSSAASIGPSLPSAALPASGSRGLQLRTGLSAITAAPQYRFLLRIGLAPAKSMAGTSQRGVPTPNVPGGETVTTLYPGGDVGAATFESV